MRLKKSWMVCLIVTSLISPSLRAQKCLNQKQTSDLSSYIQVCETTELEYQLLKDKYNRDIKDMQPAPLGSLAVVGALSLIAGFFLAKAVDK